MSAEAIAPETPQPVIDMGELAPYASATRLASVTPGERAVTLHWDDGLAATFHHLWLRDHCACARCRHPGTRERLVRVIDLPRELPAPAAEVTPEGALRLSWPAMAGLDAHEGLYDAGWLRQRADAHETDPLAVDRKTAWDASIAGDLPQVEHRAFMHTDAGLADWLGALARYGFVILRNGPTGEGEVIRVAERIGWPRETNFGRHFDVVSKPDPNNAAYTSVALEPHADLPNWQRPPDFQLLYCLANEAEGGESTLTDGLAVAEALRAQDPEAYRVLTTTPIDFRFQDEASDIAHRAPVIGCDEGGRPVIIRFNNWIRDTLRLPPEQVEPFYRAYRRLWEMLRDPAYTIRFRLRPGEMMAFDNLRVLHGRTEFYPSTGFRHLQGTYLDRDLIRSRQRVLERGAG
ncbi:MAG: TauD/TfdA family dioxygenase [Halofilum sp. (in: g-proteobacteria)]|nr:TauD/TfdA family dioxygenase [Halofilum sp. (in: g-proteobacteria)]